MSADARERIAVARDPSAQHFTKEPCNGTQRLAGPTLAAKRVRTNEHAAIVHGERRDVVVEGFRFAVRKEILLDVGDIEGAHDRTPCLKVVPDGADRLGAGEVSADRHNEILLL